MARARRLRLAARRDGQLRGSLSNLDAGTTGHRWLGPCLGYSPVESRKSGRLAVGTIAIDAIFTPVLKVNYTSEDMRVGDRTDYNRLQIEIETDGSVSPSSALHKAAETLKDHFDKISAVTVHAIEASVSSGDLETKKKGRPKKVKS